MAIDFMEWRGKEIQEEITRTRRKIQHGKPKIPSVWDIGELYCETPGCPVYENSPEMKLMRDIFGDEYKE